MDAPIRDLQYWDFLTNEDKEVYKRINMALAAPTNRNRRNKRVDDFREILEAIELFEDSDTEDRWKRCLVCGICKIPNGIAVNTTQLKRLVFKCKSSINGSLKRLGWDLIVSKSSAYDDLLKEIPYLRDHPAEVRQWTIRIGSGCSFTESNSDVTPPCARGIEEESFGLKIDCEKETVGSNQEHLSGCEVIDDLLELSFDF
jgi:hypothetical protein